jgi:hypothetical protein
LPPVNNNGRKRKKEIKMCICKEHYYSDDSYCCHKHYHSHYKNHYQRCCCHPHNPHCRDEEDNCGGEETHFKHHNEHHCYRNEGPHFADDYECCLHPSKEKLLKIKQHLEKTIQWLNEQLETGEETEK